MKESPRNESFTDGSVGTAVRLMVRGRCLPVRGVKEWHGSMMIVGVDVD